MSTTTLTPSDLQRARTTVADLTRDSARIKQLAAAATAAATASRDDTDEMIEHATRAAALEHSLLAVTRDLNAATQHLETLEEQTAKATAAAALEAAAQAHQQAAEDALTTAEQAATVILEVVHQLRAAVLETTRTAQAAQAAATAAGNKVRFHPISTSTLRTSMSAALQGRDAADRIALTLDHWIEDSTIQ